MKKNVAFNLKSLRLVQHYGDTGSGADPYLIVSYFYSDPTMGTTPTSSGTFQIVKAFAPISGNIRDDVPNEQHAGNVILIVPQIGRHAHPINIDTPDCYAGFIAVLMEQEDSTMSKVERAADYVKNITSGSLYFRFSEHIRKDLPVFSWTEADTRDLRRIYTEFVPDFFGNNTWEIKSLKDKDGFVDAATLMLMQSDAIVTKKDQTLTLGNGKGITYLLTYDVTVTHVVPPFPPDYLENCTSPVKKTETQRRVVNDLQLQRIEMNGRLALAPPEQRLSIKHQLDMFTVESASASAKLGILEDELEHCLDHAENLHLLHTSKPIPKPTAAP